MRQVGMRQFQREFHKEMKDLPFTVVRKGDIVAVVLSYEEYEELQGAGKEKIVYGKSTMTPVKATLNVPHFTTGKPIKVEGKLTTGSTKEL